MEPPVSQGMRWEKPASPLAGLLAHRDEARQACFIAGSATSGDSQAPSPVSWPKPWAEHTQTGGQGSRGPLWLKGLSEAAGLELRGNLDPSHPAQPGHRSSRGSGERGPALRRPSRLGPQAPTYGAGREQMISWSQQWQCRGQVPPFPD